MSNARIVAEVTDDCKSAGLTGATLHYVNLIYVLPACQVAQLGLGQMGGATWL